MPGQNDLWAWLQSLQQNQGAAQPYGVGSTPGYGAGPGALGMGDPRGLTAPTPGQPSMGYPPSMGPLGAAAAPIPAAPMQQNQQQQTISPDDHGDGPSMDQALQIGQNPPPPPGPADVRTIVNPSRPPLPGPTTGPAGPIVRGGDSDAVGWPPPASAPGIGAYPDSTNYPHSLTPPGSPSATPRACGLGDQGGR